MEIIVFLLFFWGIPWLIYSLFQKLLSGIRDKAAKNLFSSEAAMELMRETGSELSDAKELIAPRKIEYCNAKIDSFTCPKCQKGWLVERRGKFGRFMACSAFPNCDFTQNKEKYSEQINNEIIENLRRAYS